MGCKWKKNKLVEKSDEELENLSSKRLLLYYKSERMRFINFKKAHTCECCGELNWDIYSGDDDKEALTEYKKRDEYLKRIKSHLGKREHIKTTH